jgi:toxin ParE1/3/4
MARFTLSPAARADMEGIWDCTAVNWGETQAEQYTRDILAACVAIANGAAISRSAEDIRPGYRKLSVGSHLLFFRMTDETTFDIVRILHQRMDPLRHL